MLGRHAQIGNLGGLDDHVLVLAVFVTLYDLIFFDGRGGLARGIFQRGGEHLLVAHPFAG